MTDRAWLFAFGVCMGTVVVVAGIMLALTLSGCTIRGGESCSDVGCDMRRPDAAVPAPGGGGPL